MHRRTFLTLSSSFAAAMLGASQRLPARAADARLERWQPNTGPTLLMEWRYLAGRTTDGSDDYGFVVSVSNIRVPTLQGQEMLVMRQELNGQRRFVTKTYAGTLNYNAASATYTFSSNPAGASATWQLEAAEPRYRLSVTSPELSLNEVVLRPQGSLINEGVDGDIGVGTFRGVPIASNYHADWVSLEIGSNGRGLGRLDMQGLRPGVLVPPQPPSPNDDYDHHWFAIAAEQAGAPVWISAWRNETGGPFWAITVARGSGSGWRIATALTESSPVVAPLRIETLAWQPVPVTGPDAPRGQFTGSRWRISAGVQQPGDLLNLELEVPPGQFVTNSRQSIIGGSAALLEGISLNVSGTVAGQPLANPQLVVAEATDESYLTLLPLVMR